MKNNTVEDLAKMIDLYGTFCANPTKGDPKLQAEMIMTTIQDELREVYREIVHDLAQCKFQTIIEGETYTPTEVNSMFDCAISLTRTSAHSRGIDISDKKNENE